MANKALAISNNSTTTVANIVDTSTKLVATKASRKWIPLLQMSKMTHATNDEHVPGMYDAPVNTYYNSNNPLMYDAKGNVVSNTASNQTGVTKIQGKKEEVMFYSYTASGTYYIEVGSMRNTPIAIQFTCIVGSGAGTLSVQRSVSIDGINFTKTNISAVTVAAGATEIIFLTDQPEGMSHLFEVTVTGTTEYYAILKG